MCLVSLVLRRVRVVFCWWYLVLRMMWPVLYRMGLVLCLVCLVLCLARPVLCLACQVLCLVPHRAWCAWCGDNRA